MKGSTVMLSLPVLRRTCGECTACCTVLTVAELSKKAYEGCAHEGDKCCAIYAQRPGSCREFECLYLAGYIEGDERRRPDRLGLMLRFSDENDVYASQFYRKRFLVCSEVWQGASEGQEAKYFLGKLAKKNVVLTKRLANKALVSGPQDDVAQFMTA